MTVLKIEKYKVTASSAGMPPFLIYRRNTNSIEEVVLKGMPVGAFFDFHYQQTVLHVSPGDVILLLTDGLLELFNANLEMIDYELVKKTFCESAMNASDIIKDLLVMANQWLNGFEQKDDMSFLIIKIK